MSSKVAVRWHPECDVKFKTRYGAEFTEWIGQHPTHLVEAGGRNKWTEMSMTFDEALVLNGLHSGVSNWDPNAAENVTVRLSTPELRAEKAWYVMHWRPAGGSKVGLRPDNEVSMANRRERAKAKKERKRKRDKAKTEQQRKDEHKKDDDGKSAASSSKSREHVN